MQAKILWQVCKAKESTVLVLTTLAYLLLSCVQDNFKLGALILNNLFLIAWEKSSQQLSP